MRDFFDRDRHNDQQRSHFDVSTLTNPRMVAVDSAYVQRHVDRLLRESGIEPGQKILDIGCGLGKFTVPLADRGFEVVGLDLSVDLVDALQRDLDGRKIELVIGDILEPPAELLGQFDAVVGFFMLHHLVDLPAAFAGIAGCLKPGGSAAFLEPNAYSPLFPIQITFTKAMSWRSDYGVLRMTRRRLRHAMRSAGFESIEHTWTGLFPPFIANRVGSGLEDGLDRLPIPGPVSSFQVVVGRKPLALIDGAS